MAFDEVSAERIRKLVAGRFGVAEKKMFGGLAFLLYGNMCCGVHKRGVIVRLDPRKVPSAPAEPHTRMFDLSGRPMKGWLLVKPSRLEDNRAPAKWLCRATEYAASLAKERGVSYSRNAGKQGALFLLAPFAQSRAPRRSPDPDYSASFASAVVRPSFASPGTGVTSVSAR